MGITLGSNFTVNTALPLDDRMVVADIAARNAIPAGRRFQGMIVHVLSDLKNYQLQGGILDGNFVDISAVAPPTVNVPFVGSSLVNTYNKTLSDLGIYKTTVGTRPSGLNSGIGSPLLAAAWTQTDVGTNQLTITKASGNAQGENIRFSIPVYQTNYGKVITVQFDFSVTANYVKPSSSTDGSLIMYLEYGDGVTNTYQQLSVLQIEAPTESNNLTARYRGEFQYIVDATKSYWLMFYCPRTETTTWTAYVRNLEIRPAQYVYGSPVTDWQPLPNVAAGTWLKGSTTNPSYGSIAVNSGYYRRVGGNLEVTWTYRHTTAGGAGSGQYEIDIQAALGLTIDTSKLVVGATATKTTDHNTATGVDWFGTKLGTMSFGSAPGTSYQGTGGGVYAKDSTRLKFAPHITVTDNTNRSFVWNSASIGNFAELNMHVEVEFSVPIQGWSSSVQTSDQTDTRVVDFVGVKNSSESVTANTTNIAFTVSKDSHGAWNGTQYTVPVAGDYNIACVLNAASGSNVNVYINGTSGPALVGTGGASFVGGSTIVPNLKVGDVLSIRSSTSISIVTSTNISISRISGPSAIAASELVSLRYTNSAGTSIGTSATLIPYANKTFDSHGAWNTSTSTFTAPIVGKYLVRAKWAPGSVTNTNGYTFIFKNGAQYSVSYINGASNSNSSIECIDVVDLLAGETVQIYGQYATAVSMNSSAVYNTLSIVRLGF